jgi:ABC-type branched-subunit amino acid transport system ATPase component
MAMLLCEQYYDFAEELADHYLVMERGEVIASGPGSEMQEKGIRSWWRSERQMRRPWGPASAAP